MRRGARFFSPHHERARVRFGVLAGATAAVVVVVFVPGVQPGASAATSLAGSQGSDTALPATASAVTVDGRGAFAGLKVTVNQTQDLGNQAISISWTGATPTDSGSGEGFNTTYNENYLQIFQCWGDPSPSDPLTAVDPGPSPTQCEFGAESSAGSSAYPVQGSGFEYTRVLSQGTTWSNYDQVSGSGWIDNGPNGTGFVIEPFDAVDGTVIDQQANYNWDENTLDPQKFWLNPYFSYDNTNEIDFARTYADGDGQGLFQVDTGLEAPGLGCGQAVQPQTNGTDTVPDCWLVIVPRGTIAAENPTGLTGESGVVTSPLNPVAWQNRIAIPLQFKPVGTSCAIGANEERIVGSELATAAVSSWQPALCGQPGTPPYNYSYLSDDQARSDITQPSYGSAGMAVFSDPIDPSATNPDDPVVYAPLTLSGVVIGFNIDRQPAVVNGQPDADEEALSGTRVQNIYLTPLLVAKLLTESYQAELREVTTDKSSKYAWIQHNPISLVTDPDFLQYNPEFADLANYTGALNAASMVVEESSSDSASAVWNWVLADPAAVAWLNGSSTGEPPGDGTMLVNPLYSTNAKVNPSGVPFASPAPNSYPQNDPYCFSDPTAIVNPNGSTPEPARPLCVQDWSPYALTMQGAAQAAANSNNGGKTTLDTADPPDSAWGANGPQESGESFILAVTDSASAAQYGLQTASLSRAGDDGSSPTFIAPDQQDLLAGEAAMTPSAVPGVLLTNPAPSAADAYPLAMLTYAATTPVSLDASDRQNFATFLTYAAGSGQVSGVQAGQLPPGYVPLPAALQAQTEAAVATILNPPVPSTPAVTSPTPAPLAAPTVTTPPTTTATTTPPSPRIVPPAPPPSAAVTVPTTSAPPGPAPTTTAVPPAPAVRRAALSTVRTGAFPLGALRWAVPIGLVAGTGTAAAGSFLGVFTRRRRTPARRAAAGPHRFDIG